MQVIQENVYYRHGITVVPGAIVLDIGANIGLFVLRTARQLEMQQELQQQQPEHPSEQHGEEPPIPRPHPVTIFCFEPAPKTFRALIRNLQLHLPGALRSVTRPRLATRTEKELTQKCSTAFDRSNAVSSVDTLVHAPSTAVNPLSPLPARRTVFLRSTCHLRVHVHAIQVG